MVDGNTSVSLALIFSVIAAIGVAYNIISNSKKNNKEEVSEIMKANVKLDELRQTTQETRLDIKSMENKMDGLAKKQIEHEIRLQTVEKKVEDL